MARKLEELAAEALELSKDARAALAKRLLDSLDQPTADEVGEGWVREAERRYAELKAGTARTVSSEEVFAKFRSDNTR
jgi:putative addiction module component (TIGR02574 family)